MFWMIKELVQQHSGISSFYKISSRFFCGCKWKVGERMMAPHKDSMDQDFLYPREDHTEGGEIKTRESPTCTTQRCSLCILTCSDPNIAWSKEKVHGKAQIHGYTFGTRSDFGL
jgi:Pyruvate/2-oxoacid:ferredoxin oxidoreductase delta subunit